MIRISVFPVFRIPGFQVSRFPRFRFTCRPTVDLDCKIFRIFAYSSTREQSSTERSGTKLKTESETRERRFFFSRLTRTLKHALPISLLILRKKPTVLQSTFDLAGPVK